MENKNLKPNEKEKIALNLFYNRFNDLYDELSHSDFLKINLHIDFIKYEIFFQYIKNF